MTYEEIVKETRARFEKSLAHLQELLRSIRTGRASSSLVENIRVDYYGTPTPLGQMAAISIPEPRQILIKPFDASSLKDIQKALQKSDLGITPDNDGKVLRMNLPPLSGEQRKKYAAKVKEYSEEARIAMRNGRREMNKTADALKKDHKLTEDDNRALHEEIQEILKTFEVKVDEVLEKKTTEVLEV